MGQTKVEWTWWVMPDGRVIPGYSFNPWIGCTRVSPGCINCYAETFAGRYLKVGWGPKADRHLTADSTWKKPLHWNKMAQKQNTRFRVFCASLSDVFENNKQLELWRDRLWELIARTPNLDWLLLTKRPENISSMIPLSWHGDGFPSNIWPMTTICNQTEYDSQWPILKKFASENKVLVSGISYEPLLGPINLHSGTADWNIIGGESGFLKNTRKMELLWVKSLITQIQAMGMDQGRRLVFFKQLGVHLAKKLKLRDVKGGDFEEYPGYLNWLKIRERPFEGINIMGTPSEVAAFEGLFKEQKI